MMLSYFMKRLRKIYNVNGIFYPNRDAVELWFQFEHTTVLLTYSGETIRDSLYKDMLRRIEDDLEFYRKDGEI